VLTVRQVLADKRTFKGDAEVQVTSLLDKIMKAVKEPSSDNINLYVSILFAMAFIGYFMYSTFSGKPKLHAEQLLLSDVV
jgi:fucose permease